LAAAFNFLEMISTWHIVRQIGHNCKNSSSNSAIPNLKILALSEVTVLRFFQTVLEFFTNKRMSERKFAYS